MDALGGKKWLEDVFKRHGIYAGPGIAYGQT
jgi:hypothetical protein